jgi:hypothetical protein
MLSYLIFSYFIVQLSKPSQRIIKKLAKYAPMQIRSAVLSMTLIVATIFLIFSLFNMKTAYAHITKNFGNIQIEVGWSNEPPLVGELNNVIVQANQTSGKNTQTPIINALASMDIAVKYGGVTKPLDFVPSEETEGMYNGQMIPTRPGTYSLVMNGTIQNQKIIAEIPLDLVESTQKLNFPDAGGPSGGGIGATSSSNTAASNNIGPQFQGIVSQLANDIDSTKGSIDTLTKTNADTQKTIQDLKGTNDRLYMIGLGGAGAGAAGIIIAAVALSRKEVLKIS